MNNKDMRIKFKGYMETHFKPNIGLVAKEIGVTRGFLSDWIHERKDCSSETLNRIDKFLRKYDTRRQL